MAGPIIAMSTGEPLHADGGSFSIYEWRGSGPADLHVHDADDEAWHVLEGSVRFRFIDRELEAPAGSTVYVPAGVAHTFTTADARYLIVLTPRLKRLVEELHGMTDRDAAAAIYEKHRSRLLG